MPRMVVKESNGEVSASVEETNRIRAMLGLAPLKGTAAAAAPPPAPPPAAPEVPAGAMTAGPGLPPPGVRPAQAASAAPAAAEGKGPAAVLALKLARYTDARPRW